MEEEEEKTSNMYNVVHERLKFSIECSVFL